MSETKQQLNIFTLYQENIGLIVPMIRDVLLEAEKEYSMEWIKKAITIAVEANHRSWRYVEAILKRWKADGIDDGLEKRNNKMDGYYTGTRRYSEDI